MLKVLLLSLVALTVTQQQRPGWLENMLGSTLFVLDTIHGHRLEYDDRHDLLLLVGHDNCYLIDAPDHTWDQIAHNQEVIPGITEDLYHKITAGTGVTPMSQDDAMNKYDSRLEAWQCRNKHIFMVDYTPPSN